MGVAVELPGYRADEAKDNVSVDSRRDWAVCRSRLGKLVDSAIMETVMTVVLILNLVFAILIVDMEASGQEAPLWLSATMQILVIIYCMEISARMYVYRWEFFQTPFNSFDLLIVVADVVSTLTAILVDGASVELAPFRIIRGIRLLRTAKILVRFRSLYLLIHGLAGAIRAIMWSFVMISLSLVLCSIFAVAVIQPYVEELAATTDIFDGCARCPVAYSSVWHSYMTLFQQIVAGDSWGTVTIMVMDSHPWTAGFFLPTFLFIQLGLINMILAVIVDRAEDAREANQALKLEEKAKELHDAKKDLRDLCARMDDDDSGELTLAEVLDGYDNNKEFHKILKLMDVGKEDMKCVFGILDQDQSGSCSYDEFADALWKMRTQDAHTLLVFIKAYVTEVKHAMTESMALLRDDLRVKVHQLHSAASFGASSNNDEYMQKMESTASSQDQGVPKIIVTPPPRDLPKEVRGSSGLMVPDANTEVQVDGASSHGASSHEVRASDDIKHLLGHMSSKMEKRFEEFSKLLLKHSIPTPGQATLACSNSRLAPPQDSQLPTLLVEQSSSTSSLQMRELGSAHLPQPQVERRHQGWPAVCCVVSETAAVSRAPSVTPATDITNMYLNGVYDGPVQQGAAKKHASPCQRTW